MSHTCPNRPRSRPEPHGVPRYAHMNTEISGASARQPVACVSRPHTSPRPSRSTIRTYTRATRVGGLDSDLDGAQTRRTARKRACDARKQHTLSNGHGHGGFTAPIPHTLTNDHLGDASRSADEVGVGGHDCEHMASRAGRERGQQPRQVGSGAHITPGRVGAACHRRGNEQRTCLQNRLANVPPPAASVHSRAVHRRGDGGCIAASDTTKNHAGGHGRARAQAERHVPQLTKRRCINERECDEHATAAA